MKAVAIVAPAAVGGAVLAFFLDKDQGKRRRAMARQRIGGMTHRLSRRGERFASHKRSEMVGRVERARHPQAAQAPPPDDTSLARKVETVIFRDPQVPKGSMNVNAEAGVVFLRGHAATSEQVQELERKTRAIPGVRDVRNLLAPASGA